MELMMTIKVTKKTTLHSLQKGYFLKYIIMDKVCELAILDFIEIKRA